MSLEERKALHRRITEEAWNNGNVAAMDEEFASNVIWHVSTQPDSQGLQAYQQHIVDMRTAYPDIHLTIDELIGEGDTLAGRWSVQATYTGPSKLPVPATGKHLTLSGTWVGHFVDGKVVEDWYTLNGFDWYAQLGLLQAMVPAESDAKA